ncbi:hypothetical protein C8J57DRAFT_1492753 [Mycena rebaudengoi]|nr:hypothetical protein C8J57DRAFT_1492753 [Mycena rebaudengoi]
MDDMYEGDALAIFVVTTGVVFCLADVSVWINSVKAPRTSTSPAPLTLHPLMHLSRPHRAMADDIYEGHSFQSTGLGALSPSPSSSPVADIPYPLPLASASAPPPSGSTSPSRCTPQPQALDASGNEIDHLANMADVILTSVLSIFTHSLSGLDSPSSVVCALYM